MSIHVKIHKPVKSTMQSGWGRTKGWLLESELETKRQPEPLMGWIASGDTLNTLKMPFPTKEEAIAFAEKKGWTYTVIEPAERVVKGRTYLDNFVYKPAETK